MASNDSLKKLNFSVNLTFILNRAFSHINERGSYQSPGGTSEEYKEIGNGKVLKPGLAIGFDLLYSKTPKKRNFIFGLSLSSTQSHYNYSHGGIGYNSDTSFKYSYVSHNTKIDIRANYFFTNSMSSISSHNRLGYTINNNHIC